MPEQGFPIFENYYINIDEFVTDDQIIEKIDQALNNKE